MDTEFLTAKEVRAILRIGTTAFRNARQKGFLPAPYKLDGKRLFWKASDIEKFIESKKQVIVNA